MKFCPQCGKPVDENKQFCTSCGSTLHPPAAGIAVPEPAPTPYYTKTTAPGLTKGIIIAVMSGVIIVIVIGLVIVGAGLTGSGIIPPSLSRTLSGQAPQAPMGSVLIIKDTAPLAVPPNGVWVHINYIGSWKAVYGMPGALQTIENSGERYYEIADARGEIGLVAEKLDGSTSHALAAGIFKNGIVLVNRSSSEAYGKIALSADAGAGPVTIAETSPAGPGGAPLTPTMTPALVTPSSLGSTPVTVIKSFICPSDRINCNNNCVDVLTNSSHCGYCDTICPSAQYCLNGNCMPSCSPGQTSCNDGCFDLLSHAKHCGSCLNACPRGLVCYMGQCTAPATPMPVPI